MRKYRIFSQCYLYSALSSSALHFTVECSLGSLVSSILTTWPTHLSLWSLTNSEQGVSTMTMSSAYLMQYMPRSVSLFSSWSIIRLHIRGEVRPLWVPPVVLVIVVLLPSAALMASSAFSSPQAHLWYVLKGAWAVCCFVIIQSFLDYHSKQFHGSHAL